MIRSQLSRVILWNGALSAIPALTIRQVDRAVRRARFVEGGADALRIGHVALDRGSAEPFGDSLERLDPAAEQRQLCARGVEMLRPRRRRCRCRRR